MDSLLFPIAQEKKESMDLMSNIRFVVGGKVKDVKTEGKVDTNKEGKYTVYYVYGKQKVKAEVEVKDTKAPELKMKDSYTTELPKDIKPEDFVESVKDASDSVLICLLSYDRHYLLQQQLLRIFLSSPRNPVRRLKEQMIKNLHRAIRWTLMKGLR